MKTKKQTVHTNQAPEPIGPYSQAIWAGDTLYISGQIGLNPQTGDLVTGGPEKQAHQMMANVKAILKEAGLTIDHLIKCTIFLDDMNDFGLINEAYGSYLGVHPPAREAFEVSKLPKGAKVEISVIAVA